MQKPKNAGATIRRVVKYLSEYKFFLLVVTVAIVFSALASVIGTSYMKTIIDDYIEPMVHNYSDELMHGFILTLLRMGSVYLIGALCTYISARMMLHVSTKTLYNIRTDMFNHMEALPIRYFDTHTHGELMSRYTNDIDTLRELLSNSMTMLISSSITVVSVLTMMLIYSWQLTLLLILLFSAMLVVIRFFGGRSGRLFREQQAALGTVNGYIEEMIDGVRVVKVFCHEDKAIEEFEKLNDKLVQRRYPGKHLRQLDDADYGQPDQRPLRAHCSCRRDSRNPEHPVTWYGCCVLTVRPQLLNAGHPDLSAGQQHPECFGRC